MDTEELTDSWIREANTQIQRSLNVARKQYELADHIRGYLAILGTASTMLSAYVKAPPPVTLLTFISSGLLAHQASRRPEQSPRRYLDTLPPQVRAAYLSRLPERSLRELWGELNPQEQGLYAHVLETSETSTPKQRWKPEATAIPGEEILLPPSQRYTVPASFSPGSAKVSATVSDPVSALTDRPTSTLIVGVPGSGKGLLASLCASRLRERFEGLQIHVLDPKGSELEGGYWEGLGTVQRARLGAMAATDPDGAAEWLLGALERFQALRGPKLLVLDEVLTIATVLDIVSNKDNRATARYKLALAELAAQGDSEQSWLWLLTQSPFVADLPFKSGIRSTFRAVGLAAPHNRQAVQTLISSKGFIASPEGGLEGLYSLMQRSPVQRAWFDGGVGRWEPMPRLENRSGYDRDAGNRSQT